MLPITLAIRPSVDTQSTPFQTGAAIQAANLIRIKNNAVQKLGGCLRLIAGTFSGTCTHLLPWAALNGTQYVGVGTTVHLYVIDAGALVDITPGAGVGSGKWSLDKWGQNLIAAPSGSTIYQWIPPVAFGNIALPLLNAPAVVNGLIIASPQQQIIAWGIYSVSLGAQDPLLVGFCDVANNTVWTATATNQAGTFRIPTGSKIQQIVWTGISGLLFTDLDMYSITYVNFPYVYGFNKISQNCGAISSRAADILGTRLAWMSQNDFFQYQGGQVSAIECTVRDFVFGDTGLDRNFLDNIHCDTNTYFGEFMWRFPMIGSAGVCNGYVKWAPNEKPGQQWDYGEGQPTISAWADQSIIGAPIGTDYNGRVQQFETSNDFDGVVLSSSIQTGWFQLSKGQEFLFLERILPDFTLNTGGQISITVDFADEIPPIDTDYPIRTYGPYTVTQSTPFIIVGGRGRVARLTITSDVANTFWRYGEPLAVVSIDGSM